MADRPILFSAPMIRALLAGTKTQTRRILKPQPHLISDKGLSYVGTDGKGHEPRICAGDRLWVRETVIGEELTDGTDGVRYVADDEFITIANSVGSAVQWLYLHTYAAPNGTTTLRGRQVPSIHMPKWASRLTLTVTDVRVERLQDISADDSIAEGIEKEPYTGSDPAYHGMFAWKDYSDHPHAVAGFHHEKPQLSYRSLWDSINGAGAWDANPWIVAYSFTVHRGNIDQMSKVAA